MNELRERIKERVSAQGKITFADFMEMALYYPGLGYYASSRERVGAEGDFFTSPATHPVFAALLSLQLEQMWRLLGCPARFTVVEMGAGKGLLARDILAYLPRLSLSFVQSLDYIATERGEVSVWRALSGVAASSPPSAGSWPVRNITGCVFSNELLDAFPSHRVTMQGGGLQEVYVTLEGDDFVEVLGEPSTPRLMERLLREGITLPDGYCVEVNLNIGPWMGQVAECVERGFVLTIDYGHLARQLYAPAPLRSTLMTYYRHMAGSDPYVRLGRQDITTHVDFSAAILCGEEKGLRGLALVSQREFLLNLGLDVFLEALGERDLPYREYMANRLSMLELVRPDGMGDFKVLVQSKKAVTAPLWGTIPDSEDKQRLRVGRKALHVPLLGREHVPLLQARYPHYAGLGEGLAGYEEAGT